MSATLHDEPRIRRARPADAARLTAIARAAKARWGYPPAWLEAWRDELAITEAYLAAHVVLVAEGPGSVPAPDEARAAPDDAVGLVAIERAGSGWALEHLWVLPGAEGRGIGRALVRAALAHAARETPGARVTVLSDPHAAAFYERMGARRAGEVPAPMPGAPARVLPWLELRAGP